MKQVVLFGAGQGGKAYIRQLEPTEQVVAVCDNDPAKQGTLFSGYPVIGPAQLKDLTFEELVITTQWFQEVRQQLIEQYGVATELLRIPEKHQLKAGAPFTDEATHQLGRDVLCRLSEIATQRETRLVADFGTLLGLVRNHDILAWDDDIDFAVEPAQQPAVLDSLNDFIEQQSSNIEWHLSQLVDQQGNVASYTLSHRHPDYRPFEISVCFRAIVDDKSVHLPSLGMWYAPARHFETIDRLQWRGVTVQIPANATDYLEFVYGADWRQEKRTMAIGDYCHTQRVSLGQVLQTGFHTQVLQRRILGFGTGLAGQRAYEYFRTRPEIKQLGWLDNDKEKQGQLFLGLPVFAPEQIQELTFDRIVIASSFHAEIRKQLTQDFGVPASRIENIPSRVLKGLGDLRRPERRDLARDLMLTLCRALNEQQIPYYLDHGTLLGLFRDGDLLPWDNDIDFAIDSEYLPAVQQALWNKLPDIKLKYCKVNQWTMTAAYGHIRMAGAEQYRKRILKVYNHSDDPTSNSFNVDFIIKYKGGCHRYWLVGYTVLKAPDEFTNEVKDLEFRGTQVKIPKYADEYLSVLYNDWKTPVKRWDHSMYSNAQEN